MLLHILLQAPPAGGGYSFWITMIGIMVVMYFFMIRPQQNKQKEQKKFVDTVAKGDDVVTIGGLHGKVQSVEGDTVTLLVDKGLKLVFDKSSISMDASKRIQEKNNA